MIGVVMTTITFPKNLEDLLKSYKGNEDLKIIIVGDHKTPDYSDKLPEGVELFKIKDQKRWLKETFDPNKFNLYWRVFQENNYQRRIIGFLKAVQEGSKYIVALDDDNYPREREDLISKHVEVLKGHQIRVISSNLKYVNLLSFLEYPSKDKFRIYVRGYPLHLRGDPVYEIRDTKGKIAVNVGLWEGSPDMEALSRLVHGDIQVKADPRLSTLALDTGTYTSMCLQNIAFRKEYLLLQYEFPMNVPIEGISLGRYDDIWGGYVCKKLLDQVGSYMTFGVPVARHIRHPHSVIKDFLNEFWGMFLNLFFFTAIQEIVLEETKDLIVMYAELVTKLSKSLQFNSQGINKYFFRVWNDMLLWAEMVERILF